MCISFSANKDQQAQATLDEIASGHSRQVSGK
jgi:hypothetical protein